MKNLTIHFLYPWLLLILIPAIGLVFFTHFTTVKKYRNTRNKIISIVLHTLAITLSILVLSGLTFRYEVDNNYNELVILADFSDTQYTAKVLDPTSGDYEPQYITRENFIDDVIRESGYKNVKVGVVGFGLEQQELVGMTFDTSGAQEKYADIVNSILNDASLLEPLEPSATDIKAALLFAAEQFEHPETAKILLISDGFETDESALNALGRIISMGIKVDVVRFGNGYIDDGLQIVNITPPSYYFRAGETVELTVSLYADANFSDARLRLYDDVEGGDASVPVRTLEKEYVKAGLNTIKISYVFETEGVHKLKVVADMQTASGNIDLNNEYCTFVNLIKHDKILLLEQNESDSVDLTTILGEEEYNVTKVNLRGDTSSLPNSVSALREYDQVVLNNVAPTDLDEYAGDNFVGMLNEYVKVHGGGLLTLGGTEADDNSKPHAYNKDYFLGRDAAISARAFQEMLPVQIADYRPPLGVVFIGDFSGSMSEEIGTVRSAIMNCVNTGVIEDRDYVGVMALTDSFVTGSMTLMPGSDKQRIRNAVNGLSDSGGTNFEPAVKEAIRMLNSSTEIANKHIVIFTDGQFFDSANLAEKSRKYKEENEDITLSMVLIRSSTNTIEKMEEVVEVWGGNVYEYSENELLYSKLHDDLTSDIISGYKDEEFNPIVNMKNSPVLGNVEYDLVSGKIEGVQLKGYFGARPRSDANIILMGKYKVPIYAQWKYGNGNVGSFMCDVKSNGKSGNLMTEDVGKRIVKNMVSSVMPLGDVKYSGISLKLNPNNEENYNYYNYLYVDYGELKDGETIEGRIEYFDENGEISVVSLNEVSADKTAGCYVKTAIGEKNKFTQAEYIMKNSGTYRIIVERKKDGNVEESTELYTSFSYSDEYNGYNNKDPEQFLTEIALRTNGKTISATEPELALEDFEKSFSREYDPRALFLIIALICFLLDIAVRKFKFKWIHEIIRERKILKEKKK